MASAYAALVSLMNVLHIILHPKNPAFHPEKSRIQSLFDKVNSLVEILEAHSHCISKDLEKRMTKSAFAAEDMIETDLVKRRKSTSQEETSRLLAATGLRGHHPETKMIKIKKKSTSAAAEKSRSLLSLDLDKAIKEMKLSIQGAGQAKEKYGGQDQVLSRGLVSADVGSIPVPCKDLEEKMTKLSFAAEDVIEADLVERRKSTSTPFTFQAKKSTSAARETSRPLLTRKLGKAIQEMDLIIQEVIMQAKQNNGEQDQRQSKALAPAVGSTTVPHGDSVKVVGLKEETNRLIDQLTSRQSNRHVIPIVGMGGLGKTTLATSVYNHPRLKNRFDVKAWVTVSQVYSTRSIILPILHAIGGVQGTDHMEDEELGVKLHKALFGRRYFVIIDDIWDVQAWDKMIRFCPDDNNGSRILLTTRLLDVANRVTSGSPFHMQLLDVDRSWDLLSKTVFDQEVCPSEFEQCGKEIAKNCKGLPLAIVVISGLLKVSDRTLKHWEHVGRNIRSIIGLEDEHCMKILSLSYHQLPIHLKPCFLYLGTFPEDYKIKVSEVTKLWVVDGFLKPREDGKSLDEVALECLTDLISRNLFIVSKRSRRGKMKWLSVHDLVRDLCIKEAKKEKFLYVDDGFAELPTSIESERRLVFHRSAGSQRRMQQMVFSRSFIWFSMKRLLEIPQSSLLRVIVSSEERIRDEYIMWPVNLRLLRFSLQENSLSSIPWTMNLETLIFMEAGDKHGLSIPDEIWNLWRLKHLIVFPRKYTMVTLPNPPTRSNFVHENLQTLKGVRVLGDFVLDRIPNIKNLKIWCHDYKSIDFGHCQKLENVWFEVENLYSLECNFELPHCLRKLTLYRTRIPWENMTMVGSLPNLDSLHLAKNAFIGEEWNSVEGEFEKLTYLKIEHCSDLVRWIVEESSHFPSLEHLELEDMNKLEEIPLVFGELMTLVSINVEGRTEASLVVSAREIVEEQQRGGNDDLTVKVTHTIPRSEYSVELEEELKVFNFEIQKSIKAYSGNLGNSGWPHYNKLGF